MILFQRDPNSVQTLSAFRKGVDWAKSGHFTQQDIDEAKLSVFSAVDSPVAPADKGEAARRCDTHGQVLAFLVTEVPFCNVAVQG